MSPAQDPWLDALRARVERAAAQHAALGDAIAKERLAEGEVLAELIESVKPALPAICGKLVIASSGTAAQSHGARGVIIGGDPDVTWPAAQRTITWCNLVLLEDGSLQRWDYDGVERRLHGDVYDRSWRSRASPITPYDAARTFGLLPAFTSLLTKLEKVGGPKAASKIAGIQLYVTTLGVIVRLLAAERPHGKPR